MTDDENLWCTTNENALHVALKARNEVKSFQLNKFHQKSLRLVEKQS